MRRTSLTRYGLLAVGSLLLATTPAGCSFLFVTEAPPNHQRLPYFDCTSSRAMPVIDTVLAGLYGAAAVASLADSASNSSQPSSGYSSGNLSVALPALVLVGGLTASAISGYSQTGKCREAKADMMERLMLRDQTSPAMAPGAAPVDPWLNPGPGMGGPSSAPAYPPPAGPPPTPATPATPPTPPVRSLDSGSGPGAKQGVAR